MGNSNSSTKNNINTDIANINDSKKLSTQKRKLLYKVIKENAISIGVGISYEDYFEEKKEPTTAEDFDNAPFGD